MVIGYVAHTQPQQEIELCPGERNSFTYWANASTSNGGWLWLLNRDVVSTSSSVRITYRDTGFYLITVHYRDECGEPIRFYRVKVKRCPESAIFFPNAFTPNGINPIFKPIISIADIENYELTIINRWGQPVFNTKKIEDGWNGQMGNQDAPNGLYIYQIQINTGFKKEIIKRGLINLIR